MNPTVTPTTHREPRPRRPADRLYGLLAEFETGDELVAAARKAAKPPATPGWTATARTRSARWPTRWASRKSEMGTVMFIGGLTGACAGFLHAVLGERLRLPAQRRRPAVLQLAVVHPDHVRDAGADDGADRAVRAARDVRPAAAPPPAVQLADVRPGDAGTGSSCASRRSTRSTTRPRPGPSSPTCTRCRSRRCWNDHLGMQTRSVNEAL